MTCGSDDPDAWDLDLSFRDSYTARQFVIRS